MYHDPEIKALSNAYEALKGLDNDQITRIIDWVTSKFELNQHPDLETGPGEVDLSPQPVPVEAVEPAAEPIKKRRGRKPGQVRRRIEETPPQPVAVALKGFMKYDSLEEIFNVSTTKKSGAKMLLAAAYLQEKENLKELSSYDISSRLKKIGEEVKHPSAAINSLIRKKPPLLLQTGTHGASAKSRRKFRVTEEGLRIAKKYINE
ncbi:MAG: hypothetical protein PVH61_33595 [Candidatus Aminicenantes bacterium]|jgi:hypothetical protein